jgi:D-3-phosphoglycerate dehydrogenase / 2-oxoglutarate reductase
MTLKVLITCPPMLQNISSIKEYAKKNNIELTTPDIVQTLSEEELIKIVPEHDGWIIGDDPATEKVFCAGKNGRLKAAVKWGIGIDNVDINSCNDLNINISNTPNMFGAEVADLAIGYLIGLARNTYFIDREVRKGNWPKNSGLSLEGKKLALVGYGDIGKNVATRANALGLDITVYDPAIIEDDFHRVALWPNQIEECDFIIFTCALNPSNHHMFNKEVISSCKNGLRVINVARGGLINEPDLCDGLKSSIIHSAALDVYEEEPLPMDSYLRTHPMCIFGSHNASNTIEAVYKTNIIALDKILDFLKDD